MESGPRECGLRYLGRQSPPCPAERLGCKRLQIPVKIPARPRSRPRDGSADLQALVELDPVLERQLGCLARLDQRRLAVLEPGGSTRGARCDLADRAALDRQ